MSEVTLQVGGRGYAVACADGEEAHVRHLAAVIDGKLQAMGGSLAPSDSKNLLFAALILADEVEELREKAGIASPKRDGVAESGFELAVGGRLEALADRLENLAWTLENAGRNA